jgi:PAS domain S-box-containing protein
VARAQSAKWPMPLVSPSADASCPSPRLDSGSSRTRRRQGVIERRAVEKVEDGQLAVRNRTEVEARPATAMNPGLGAPRRADLVINSRVGLLTELDIPAIATDLDGIICHWNQPAAELYGHQQSQMLGARISTVHLSQTDDAIAPSVVGELIRTGRWQGELEIEDATGSPLRLEVRATVRLDAHDRPVGFEAAFTDLRDRVEAERRATMNQSRLRLAHRIGGLGSWEWDPVEDRLVASDMFTSLLGLDPGTELTIGDALAAMPFQDRPRVRSALQEMRSGAVDSVSFEHRVGSADGAPRWLESHCVAGRDQQGLLTCVRGTTHDVTARVRADERLRAAGVFWQATLDSLTAHIAILDEHGGIVAVNAAWRRFAESQGGDSDYVGRNYIAVCETATDPIATVVARGLGEILAGERDLLQLDYPCHSQCKQRWFLLRATRYVGPGPLRVVVMHADVTERHQAEEQAFMQAELLDQIDASVIVTDLDLRVLSWNAGAERLYGWSAAEAIGRPANETILPPAANRPADEADFHLALQREGRWEGEYMVRRKDGSQFPAHVRSRLISDQDGRVTGAVNVAMDITERKESEQALLSARNYLRAVVDSMGEGMYALDSDGRPTYVNQAAKDLLGWSSKELAGCDMHALTHNRRADGSPLLAKDCPILAARRDGKVVRVEDDIFIRWDGSELPVAYTAAPFATDDGIDGCVVVFEDNTKRKAAAELVGRDLEKLAWVERIQHALTEDRFVLYAQPIIDLRTGALVQRELLIRMLPPEDAGVGAGLIAPGSFLPVAEEYGLINEIDRWVIDRAAELASMARPVEINVSARSISSPGLLAHIEHVIERTGADPGKMVFEITETTLVSDEPAARAFVEGLHALGCKVALDDFGTGYGGFTYLKQLPVDFLKIDIEFVRDVLTNSASRNVVQAIVNLAAGFGLKTVAEGVEDAETLDLLRELGADCAQGYHVGRPEPLVIASQRPQTEGDPK